MAAVQRLLRAAASGGSATAAARRHMTSLAPDQAPSAAAGFPFASEQRMRRRPMAERNVQWVFLGCPGVGKGTYASRLSRLLGVPHFATRDLVREELASTGPLAAQVLGYEPTSHLSGAQVLPRWFSSLASNGSQVQKSQISETYKSGSEMKQSDAQKSSEEATPKVLAFSPLEAAIAKPRSSPLTIESSKVKRSEIATQVTFYMIPALLLVSKNSISTSLLVGAVFHQVYMFHKEILLDYVHHDITRKWALIYLKLLLLVMAKDTIMYFNLF